MIGYILVRRDVTVVAGTTMDLTIALSEGTGTYTENVTVEADRFRPAEPAVASQQVLGSADIQSLADLGNSFERIRSMKLVPFTQRVALQVAVIAALPSLPLVLLAIPVAEILKLVAGALL